MKKSISTIFAVWLCLISAFWLVSCGEKELTDEEAYSEVGTAIENVLSDVKELSLTLGGTVEITALEPKETADSAETAESPESAENDETGKYTAEADVKVKLNDDDVVNEAALKVTLTDNKDQALKLELYLKDGYSYSYTNLFGENYSYSENDGEKFDVEDVDKEELKKTLDGLKERLPKPKATKKGDTVTLVWTVNADNAKDYVKAFGYLEGKEVTDEEAAETLKDVDIEKGELTLTIENGRIIGLKVIAKASGEGMRLNAELSAEVLYSGVTISFDNARLEEIKSNANKDASAE